MLLSHFSRTKGNGAGVRFGCGERLEPYPGSFKRYFAPLDKSLRGGSWSTIRCWGIWRPDTLSSSPTRGEGITGHQCYSMASSAFLTERTQDAQECIGMGTSSNRHKGFARAVIRLVVGCYSHLLLRPWHMVLVARTNSVADASPLHIC